MKKTAIGKWIILAVAICSPLIYFSMYLPVWNGKEFYLTSDNLFPIIIFAVQCLAFICSVSHLCLCLFKKDISRSFSVISLSLTFLSIVSLCFVGYFFVLELLNVPWFPSQS